MKKILFSTILCLAFAIPPELHAQLESVVPVPSLDPSPTSIISPLPTPTNIPSATPSPTVSALPSNSPTSSPSLSPSLLPTASVVPSLEPSPSVLPSIIASPQISSTPSASTTASPIPSPASSTPQPQSSTPSPTPSTESPAIGGAISEPSPSPTPTTSPNIIARRTTSAPTKILDAGYYNFIEAPLAALQGQTYVKGYYTDQGLSPRTTTQLNLLGLFLVVFGLYIHQTNRINFPIISRSVVKHLKHSARTTSAFLLVFHKRLWRSLIK